MTLQERAAAYAAAFPDRPPLQVVAEQGQPVIYGVWMGGQNYRSKTKYYGSYPPKFLERVGALFPDVEPITDGRLTTLHAFSGSLPEGPYVRCDLVQPSECQCNVYDLDPSSAGTFDLVLADPPYSSADAEKYETAGVDRLRATAALARVTRPGGHLVWLDCVWPMFSKRDWRTVGRITFIRSTNHRVRLISIFERRAA